MRSFFALFVILASLFLGNLAWAEMELVSDYSYIVGTLNTTAYNNDNSPATFESYGMEDIRYCGTYMHYYFFVDAGNTTYRCVIDLKDNHLYDPPYRIINLDPSNESYYNGIFDATNGKHSISKLSNQYGYDRDEGALDYIRHPGILLDMANDNSWHHMTVTYSHQQFHWVSNLYPVIQSKDSFWSNKGWETLNIVQHQDNIIYHYSAPAIDALFENVVKLYVFGDYVYNSGQAVPNTIHNIHQFQGDNNSYNGNDGIYQDGAVIFEYADGSRKLLMVKFADHYDTNNTLIKGQIDFSYDSTGGTYPNNYYAGRAADFTYLEVGYNPYLDGNHVIFGPYYATQIEAITAGDHVANTASTNVSISFNYCDVLSTSCDPAYGTIIESDHSGTGVEYLRSSEDLWLEQLPNVSSTYQNRYYLHVYYQSGTRNNFIPIYIRYR